MVISLGRDPIVLAKSINGALSAPQKAALMADLNPAGWAMNSAYIAKTVIYEQTDGKPNSLLKDSDVMTDAGISRLQLAKAGYALAGVLNRAFN